jgi:hypothetical protein
MNQPRPEMRAFLVGVTRTRRADPERRLRPPACVVERCFDLPGSFAIGSPNNSETKNTSLHQPIAIFTLSKFVNLLI